ncbi:MAG: MFS transporter [Balneolaceae bacterium]|nr:MFS transporter [Balneolaceae bacterium]
MKHWKIKLSLFLNYFVFAILLNSVGIVILQVQLDYGITEEAASVLEGYKDLSIAIFSFLVASYIPKFGYKRSMLIGLLFVTVASVVMRLVGGFMMTKILFATVGVSFALVKVSVYSSVSLITDDSNEHSSFMNLLEGLFMIGVLSGYWIFGWFIDWSKTSDSIIWLDTYWVLAIISAAAFVLLLFTDIDESEVQEESQDVKESFLEMIGLVRLPLVLIFIGGVFLYVYIEQGIGTWIPTFNNKILMLPNDMSVQATSIFAAATAIGRLASGAIMKKINWFWVLVGSVVCAMVLVVVVLPLTRGVEPGSVKGWLDAPLAAYVLPLIGLFIAPIYPTLSSTVLSKLPKTKQSGMTGLIVIFSALGGTSGSIITGYLFGLLDGITAFYLVLIPMGALMLLLFPYRKLREKFEYESMVS